MYIYIYIYIFNPGICKTSMFYKDDSKIETQLSMSFVQNICNMLVLYSSAVVLPPVHVHITRSA